MAAIRRRVRAPPWSSWATAPTGNGLRRWPPSSPGSVVLAGQVSEEDLPRYYRLGDVFAMPCRDRLGGFEVEGWGNVFIEAAACGRPVVVGDSGGAARALVDGETGVLVDGTRRRGGGDRGRGRLLADPVLAQAMGADRRASVERHYTWPRAAAELAGWLCEVPSTVTPWVERPRLEPGCAERLAPVLGDVSPADRRTPAA